MVQLVYTSTAVPPWTDDDLGFLLMQARARNVTKAISGMLLYDFGRFLQVLEGPDENVAEVFASILRDSRHTNVMLISLAPIEAREFDAWSMDFLDLSTVTHPGAPAMTMKEAIAGVDCAAKAKRYLREFQGALHYQLTFKDQQLPAMNSKMD